MKAVRFRLTVARLMTAVACAGVGMGLIRWHWFTGGFGSVVAALAILDTYRAIDRHEAAGGAVSQARAFSVFLRSLGVASVVVGSTLIVFVLVRGSVRPGRDP